VRIWQARSCMSCSWSRTNGRVMQDGGTRWRPLVVVTSVARGKGRPQLRCERSERPLGRTGADGSAR
jgi:hypothetical protein